MCLLFESVKVQNRRLHNIEGHNDRVANSRRTLFGMENKLDLRDFIKIPDTLDDGLYKCRIVYSREVQKVEFLSYKPKPVRTLRLVHHDIIHYRYKYSDRSGIDNLVRNADADDILIVQNGCISDASHANIVFFDGNTWTTPDTPLLSGTKREMLLDRGVIQEKKILCSELSRFTHAALINALLDLGDTPFISVNNILPPVSRYTNT
jgi:4-amino-4-deoxychorismate lyase